MLRVIIGCPPFAGASEYIAATILIDFTAYRLGYEESKEAMSLILRCEMPNAKDAAKRTREIARFFVERNKRSFNPDANAVKIKGKAWLDAIRESSLEVMNVIMSDEEIFNTATLLKGQFLTAINEVIDEKASTEKNYGADRARIEQECADTINKVQEELPTALQKLEEDFAQRRLQLAGMQLRQN